MDPYDPPLDKARHLRYWQRCVRTLLPHHYTSMDSTRLSLGFFILASIDLLSTPSPDDKAKPLLSPSDRRTLRRWVLSCQHPNGGFCGSPTHVFPRAHQTADNDSENAHLGGTYFALLLLAILADDDDEEEGGAAAGSAFAGVDRVRTLRWLRRLQRPEDGSFGEAVYDPPRLPSTSDEAKGVQGEALPPVVAGGRDMRYCYLAASVRWMLRGDLSPEDDDYVDDIDVDALVAHIHRGQTFDGGFAESWQHESHAGYAYCAVAALAMLDRPLVEDGGDQPRTPYRFAQDSEILRKGVGNLQGLVSFLVSRQFAYLIPPSSEENAAADGDDDDEDPETANFRMADLSLSDDVKYIGFNGRCNKIADTCYTWWTQGTLAVLGLLTTSSPSSPSSSSSSSSPTTNMLVDPASLKAQRAFLLEKTQHIIGGFGKNVGSPPDVGHGCLGLAALATMGDPSLKRLDPALCVSVDTVAKVAKARQGLLNRCKEAEEKRVDGDKESSIGGGAFERSLVDMAASMRGAGGRPAWLDDLVAA